MPGVHRVRRRRGAKLYEYWYAYRGGAPILSVGPCPQEKLEAEILKRLPAALAAYEAASVPAVDHTTLYGLITRYLAPSQTEPSLPPPHLRKLGERTLRDHRKHLDRVRAELGQMELAALRSPKVRAHLLAWRDAKASTPKTADELLYALSRVLEWARDRAEIPTNPIDRFPRLYRVDRSEIIWSEEALKLLLDHADPELRNFVELAVWTGFRLGDLLKLPRSAVREDTIVFQTSKSRGRRTAVVPILDGLRPVLERIPQVEGSLTLLNSSRGRPWSEAGLESAMRRAKLAALKTVQTRDGPGAKSGLEPLRIHDLRGTAATNFVRWGLADEDIGVILGWKPDQVREIRRRYVGDEAFGRAVAARVRENVSRTDFVKRFVKHGPN